MVEKMKESEKSMPSAKGFGDEASIHRQDSTEAMDRHSHEDSNLGNSTRRRKKQQGNKLQRLLRAIRGQDNPLPPSHPANWPEPTLADLKERPTRVVYVNKDQGFTFCDNFIKTSKYELWSFMPKFLAMEFHPRKKIANLYFLIVSSMQAIPAITSTFSYPILLLPLSFIVLIDMIFTIIEDASRHKADAIANASQVVVLDKATSNWQVKERWEVAVGDFVKVHNREEVPADMLVVAVHERYRPTCSGVCYVETKSLDGETNLKIRQVQKILLGRVEGHNDLESFSGRVVMEHPNKSIASFTGSLEVSLTPRGGAPTTATSEDNSSGSRGGRSKPKIVKEPITPDNLLLRGTVLRNTKWATGLVISTGHDTKVMMSIAKAPEKSSHLNARINTEIKGLALMLFLFCIVGGLGSSIWQLMHQPFRNEVLMQNNGLVGDFVVQFFYYLLLLYGFVPISLYVSQNFIRYFQAWFMDQDLDMYYEPTDIPSRVRTMNLNEDLGQITHVFSDKTGTLTQNVMDFRKCTIMGHAYGKGMTEIGQAALKLRGVPLSVEEMEAEKLAGSFAAPHVNFYDPTMFQALQNEADSLEGISPLGDFFKILALCHTVIPERPIDTDEIVLSASSPDDEALVLGAKYFGVEFAERVNTSAVLYRTAMPGPLSPSGKPFKETYEILRILGFNSVRKRMSVVVREPDGRVKVMAKGADTTMAPLLREDTPKELLDTTMEHLEAFALEGLRTLMVGFREMAEEEYAAWDEEYDAAINDLTEVADQQAGRPNRIDQLMAQAEQGLTLLGGTAIEDKLQTGVGETIEKLVRGGMVVWVITGDKEETAINIGVACKLVWAEEKMDRCIINTKTSPTSMAVKDRLLHEFQRYSEDMAACARDGRACKPRCLVIDGAAFALIEDAPLTSLHGPLDGKPSLADLAMQSPDGVSSLSPSQTQRHITGSETPNRFTASSLNNRWRRDKPATTHPRTTSSSNLSSRRDVTESISASPPTPLPPPFSGVSTVDSIFRAGGDEKEDKSSSDTWKGGVGGEAERAGDVMEGGGDGGFQVEKAGGKGKGGVGELLKEVVVEPGDVLSAKDALLQFSGVCQAFVGCRMSPDQKRQLVHLIKDNNPDARTLAVGDGANDVPMIQAAHVGVGISGQEGLQAVNASDYSLAQFRFLQKLLLCHGRFNYRRMCFASNYLFYKSVSWAVPLFLYAFFNGLSGQVFYDYVNSTMWALLYTGLPIVLLGIYDMDVLPQTALRYPWLYRNGVDDELLTKTFFWGWIAQGVLESCWVTIPLLLLQTGGVIMSGETPAVLAFGQGAFQAMTLAVNMKIVFIQRRWHWAEAFVLALSTGMLFAVSWFLSASPLLISLDWEWYGMQTALFKDPNYWAVTVFGVMGVLMRDVAWKAYHRWWHPKLHHLLVEMEKGHLKDIDLPHTLRRTFPIDEVIQEDTTSRMLKMRSLSVQRVVDHRGAITQALAVSGSGRGPSVSSPGWSAEAAAAARYLDSISPEESRRPTSASGRLSSLSQLLEGLNKSPLEQPFVSVSKRGRSAGSSPVYSGQALRSTGGVMRWSGSLDQDQAAGIARCGYAFSHDPSASTHEIKMIMRDRAPSGRRAFSRQASLPAAASRLPVVDDGFQAHLKVLQANHAYTIEEENSRSGEFGGGSSWGGGTGGDYPSTSYRATITNSGAAHSASNGSGSGSFFSKRPSALPAASVGKAANAANAAAAISGEGAETSAVGDPKVAASTWEFSGNDSVVSGKDTEISGGSSALSGKDIEISSSREPSAALSGVAATLGRFFGGSSGNTASSSPSEFSFTVSAPAAAAGSSGVGQGAGGIMVVPRGDDGLPVVPESSE